MNRRTFLKASTAFTLATGFATPAQTQEGKLEQQVKFWPEIGKRAPKFPDGTKLLSGEPISLKQFEGGVVLLDFWKAQTADSEKRRSVWSIREYEKRDDFHIVSVTLDKDKKQIEQLAREASKTTMQICDGTGWKGEMVQRYHVKFAPTRMLIDHIFLRYPSFRFHKGLNMHNQYYQLSLPGTLLLAVYYCKFRHQIFLLFHYYIS